jgi:hypothetical protein
MKIIYKAISYVGVAFQYLGKSIKLAGEWLEDKFNKK